MKKKQLLIQLLKNNNRYGKLTDWYCIVPGYFILQQANTYIGQYNPFWIKPNHSVDILIGCQTSKYQITLTYPNSIPYLGARIEARLIMKIAYLREDYYKEFENGVVLIGAKLNGRYQVSSWLFDRTTNPPSEWLYNCIQTSNNWGVT